MDNEAAPSDEAAPHVNPSSGSVPASAAPTPQVVSGRTLSTEDEDKLERILPGLEWFHLRHEEDLRSAEDFDNPRLEYRRLFSEAWGTFLLVLVAAGAAVVGAQAFGADLTLPAKALAPGMMVMGIIFFMGTVSGAHLNPAVTLAFSLRGDFPWRRVPGYLVAQFIGAVLAALVLQWMFGDIMAGATLPADGVSPTIAVLTEFLLTLGLVSVILGTATGARNIGIAGAIAVGSYIGLVSVWGAPVSGASMNPFRSLGPALVGWDLSQYWIYVVGPLAGAIVAVIFEFILRGGPTSSGARAAQGVLTPEDPSAL